MNIERDDDECAKIDEQLSQSHENAPITDNRLKIAHKFSQLSFNKCEIVRNGSLPDKRSHILQLFEQFEREFPLFAKNIMCACAQPDSNDVANGEYTECKQFDVLHLQLVAKCLAQLHAASLICQRQTAAKDLKINDPLMIDGDNLEPKVISHGAVQRDNLRFRYEHGLPIACQLRNFQHFHYAPLGDDLIHCLYATTTARMRQTHFHHVVRFYRASLAAELHKANLQLDDIIAPDDLQLLIHRLLIKTKLALHNHRVVDPPTESLLTSEDCFEIIRNKMADDYEFIQFELKPLEAAVGYLGDHKRLHIHVRAHDDLITLKLFAKFMPHNRMQRQITQASRAMIKEAMIYEKIFPLMQRLGIDLIDECVAPARFLRSNDVIVFDDLATLEYRSASARAPMSPSDLEMALDALAKLHASSIILEEKMSVVRETKYRINDYFPEQFYESFFTHRANAASLIMRSAIAATSYLIEEFARNPATLHAKSRVAFTNLYEEVKPWRAYRNVLSHGDLWASNLMYRWHEGATIDCKIIDFQIVRYVPPAHDLLAVLYLNTNRAVRAQHLDHLIDFYYARFSAYLRMYGCEPERIYTRAHFLDSCKALKLYAVTQTVLYSQATTIDPELIREVTASETETRRFFYDDRVAFIRHLYERDAWYKERARETIWDLEETCDEYV